jgi:hypothetical protein
MDQDLPLLARPLPKSARAGRCVHGHYRPGNSSPFLTEKAAVVSGNDKHPIADIGNSHHFFFGNASSG